MRVPGQDRARKIISGLNINCLQVGCPVRLLAVSTVAVKILAAPLWDAPLWPNSTVLTLAVYIYEALAVCN